MKVAVAQITPKTANIALNQEKMKKFIIESASKGAQLVVFPELALSGYNCGDDFFRIAETIPGESTIYFEQLAKKFQIHIIYGMPEKSIPGILYNSAVLIGPEGFIGSWRKNALPGHATDIAGSGTFPDRRFFKNGNGLEVFNTSIGRIGLLICYDIFYPELARLLTLKGADILVGISGSPSFEREIFEPVVRVRALENTIDFVYTNLVGQEGETSYWGGSCIVSAGDADKKLPGYPIVCKASYDKEEIVMGEIFPEDRKIRQFSPVLRDITTTMYDNLKEAHEMLV